MANSTAFIWVCIILGEVQDCDWLRCGPGYTGWRQSGRSLPVEKKLVLSPGGNCLEAPFQQCVVHGDAAVAEEGIQLLPAIQGVLGRLTQQ